MFPSTLIDIFFILFTGIPLIILVVGFVLFLVKVKRRRTIGIVLIVSGVLELSFWLLLFRSLMFNGILLYIGTIVLGITSLIYSYNTT